MQRAQHANSQKVKNSFQMNLYLVGFMGVGKSTLGKHVAKQLDMVFIDSDTAVEERVGKSVREIFEQHGEDYFRNLEKEFVESGHPETGCIVACGGGLLQTKGVLEMLEKKGVVICLFASPETILKRTSHRDTRPLLNVEEKGDRITTLLKEREKHYLSIGSSIVTENRPLSEITRHAIRIYKREIAKNKR